MRARTQTKKLPCKQIRHYPHEQFIQTSFQRAVTAVMTMTSIVFIIRTVIFSLTFACPDPGAWTIMSWLRIAPPLQALVTLPGP
jgi:hypothetical protein